MSYLCINITEFVLIIYIIVKLSNGIEDNLIIYFSQTNFHLRIDFLLVLIYLSYGLIEVHRKRFEQGLDFEPVMGTRRTLTV